MGAILGGRAEEFATATSSTHHLIPPLELENTQNTAREKAVWDPTDQKEKPTRRARMNLFIVFLVVYFLVLQIPDFFSLLCSPNERHSCFIITHVTLERKNQHSRVNTRAIDCQVFFLRLLLLE
jgi:hypothetical protein